MQTLPEESSETDLTGGAVTDGNGVGSVNKTSSKDKEPKHSGERPPHRDHPAMVG